jgi:hypothetical protein
LLLWLLLLMLLMLLPLLLLLLLLLPPLLLLLLLPPLLLLLLLLLPLLLLLLLLLEYSAIAQEGESVHTSCFTVELMSLLCWLVAVRLLSHRLEFDTVKSLRMDTLQSI